jgi:hypothetical protein
MEISIPFATVTITFLCASRSHKSFALATKTQPLAKSGRPWPPRDTALAEAEHRHAIARRNAGLRPVGAAKFVVGSDDTSTEAAEQGGFCLAEHLHLETNSKCLRHSKADIY